ncbi:hypothetical protein IMSAG192_00135 [Muribaculaceae bacterium]|nr:hypothetical protein IMSAG192_00135 [Muribaculaceae bacterium]
MNTMEVSGFRASVMDRKYIFLRVVDALGHRDMIMFG